MSGEEQRFKGGAREVSRANRQIPARAAPAAATDEITSLKVAIRARHRPAAPARRSRSRGSASRARKPLPELDLRASGGKAAIRARELLSAPGSRYLASTSAFWDAPPRFGT